MRSKRFEALDARPVKKDGFVTEWPEVGLIAMNSNLDPKPSLKIVRIKNTLNLETIEVSEALLPCVEGNKKLERLS